jgi:hypothetical protein
MARNPQNLSSPQRCLVLLQDDLRAADPLVRALCRRGLDVHLVSSPPAAMASLAQTPSQFMIIVQPACVPWLSPLRSAVQRYYPRLKLWQYAPDATGHCQLLPLNGRAQTASPPAPLPSPPSPPSPQPDPGDPGDFPPPQPLLTPEEIEMLLSPLPP